MANMSDYEPSRPPADKLRFLKSPVVHHDDEHVDAETISLQRLRTQSDDDDSKIGHGRPASGRLPEFVRVSFSPPRKILPCSLPPLQHAEPTLLEVFFDLFFAANYNVFSDNQEVTSHSRFNAYFGYFL